MARHIGWVLLLAVVITLHQMDVFNNLANIETMMTEQILGVSLHGLSEPEMEHMEQEMKERTNTLQNNCQLLKKLLPKAIKDHHYIRFVSFNV